MVQKTHKVNSVETEEVLDSSDNDEVGLVVEHALAAKESMNLQSKWIIDSGATSHICKNKSLFVKLYPLNPEVDIKLGNGHTLKATAQGTV